MISKRVKELTGQRFGHLVVGDYAGLQGNCAMWKTKCDCGVTKNIRGTNLRFGVVNSCGCKSRISNLSHGLSKPRHPIYMAWSSMLVRCKLGTSVDKNYAARGIRVCKRWRKFENFLTDMGSSYKTGLTLDRVDNSGNYTLGNCEWRTVKQQARNRRLNRYVNTPRGRMLLCEASELSGVHRVVLTGRIERGWPIEKLFDQTRQYRKKNK